MDDLLDRIIAESTLFENASFDSYDNLLASLRLADEKIISRLATTKGEWTRLRLQEMRKLINDEITKAYGGLFEAVVMDSVESANIAYSLIGGQLGLSVPVSVVNEISNSNRNIQGYQFKDLFKLEEEKHARILKVLVASGVSNGRSIDAIISDYQIKSDKLSRANIRTNINTTVAESRTIARHESFERLKRKGVIVGYMYNSVLDQSTSDWCINHDNKRYDNIQDIEDVLHTHFNCRSIAVPLTKNKVDNKRASTFGEVDGLSYKEWFATTPDWFKQSKLTKKQYEDYKKSAYEVGGLTDLTKKASLKDIKSTSERIIKDITSK